jgi:glutamate-1-semialdehyde 2,1-aminomutase
LFWPVLGEVVTQDGCIRTPKQIPAEHKEHFRQVFHSLLTSGVYLPPSAFEVGFLSTAHTDAQLEDFVAAFARAMQGLVTDDV